VVNTRSDRNESVETPDKASLILKEKLLGEKVALVWKKALMMMTLVVLKKNLLEYMEPVELLLPLLLAKVGHGNSNVQLLLPWHPLLAVATNDPRILTSQHRAFAFDAPQREDP
jgi:hypothetical protein